jgi:hypothetical protein
MTHDSSPSKTPLPEYIEAFFLSDAVRNQDKGELQVTLGVDSWRTLGTNSSLQMEYGITNRLQASFETGYGKSEQRAGESSEWNSASFGLQYQAIQRRAPFALSLGVAFGIPSRSGHGVGYEPMILAARTIRRLQVHASFLAELEQRESEFRYNIASVYPFRHRWFPTLEFNGRHVNANEELYLTVGLYHKFDHRFELGVGVPVGLGGISVSAGIIGKLSWGIGGDI